MILDGLKLKLAAGGMALLGAAAASSVLWALLERTGRLELQVTNVRLADQVGVLADGFDRQTKEIKRSAELGRALVAQNAELVDQARRAGAAIIRATARSETAASAAAAPAGTDCRDAWREILAGP